MVLDRSDIVRDGQTWVASPFINAFSESIGGLIRPVLDSPEGYCSESVCRRRKEKMLGRAEQKYEKIIRMMFIILQHTLFCDFSKSISTHSFRGVPDFT